MFISEMERRACRERICDRRAHLPPVFGATLAVLAILGLVLTACDVSVSSTHQVTLQDDGATVKAHTGDLIQIDLPLERGYAGWQLQPSPSTLLEPIFSGKVQSVGTSGTGEADRFVYRAVKGGHVKVIGRQIPACGDPSCAPRSFTVAVAIS